MKADRTPPTQDPSSPTLYENAAQACAQQGHQFKRWLMPDGRVKALCERCGRTYPLDQDVA